MNVSAERLPYIVEVDSFGCKHCKAGRTWFIVGPDKIASSTSYEDEDDAYRMAEYLNHAYAAGRASVIPPQPARDPAWDGVERRKCDSGNDPLSPYGHNRREQPAEERSGMEETREAFLSGIRSPEYRLDDSTWWQHDRRRTLGTRADRATISVQACRPEDRAMLSTPAGQELLAAAVNEMTQDQQTAPDAGGAGAGLTEKYPTIARIADLTLTTVNYQQHDLVREAALCWRELSTLQQDNARLSASLTGEVNARLKAERERDAARALDKSVALLWAKHVERYKRCGSDWHERMPGDWPAEVTLTVQDCRDAYARAHLKGQP